MIIKGRQVHKKLLAKSRKIAPEIGFSLNENRMGYKEIPPDLLINSLAKTCFGKMHRIEKVTVYNVFSKQKDSIAVFLFRYRYSSGGSFRGTGVHLTAACFVSSRLKLPTFRLAPRTAFDRIHTLLGSEPFGFPMSSYFEKNNSVQGDEESAVRSVFSEAVLDCFKGNEDISIEGSDDVFLFYRYDVIIEPENLYDFYKEAERVFFFLTVDCQPIEKRGVS